MKKTFLLLLLSLLLFSPLHVSAMMEREERNDTRTLEEKVLDISKKQTEEELIKERERATPALTTTGFFKETTKETTSIDVTESSTSKNLQQFEKLEEDLTDLNVLEQRLQEALMLIGDLQSKGPPMEELDLLERYQLWSERHEFYKKAEADLSKQSNGNKSSPEGKGIEEKLKELLEASEIVMETLEQSLSHFALKEMRRSNTFTSLQASDNEKYEIEKALREKIIITPEQQQKELQNYYTANEEKFKNAQELWIQHIPTLQNHQETQARFNRCHDWFIKQEEASATDGPVTKSLKAGSALAGEIAAPVSNFPELHAQTAGLALGLISSGLNWASTLPQTTSGIWRQSILEVNRQAHSEATSAVNEINDQASMAQSEAEKEKKRFQKEIIEKITSESKKLYDLFSNAHQKTPQEWAEQLCKEINLPETFKALLSHQHPDDLVTLGQQLWLERKKTSRELFRDQEKEAQSKIKELEDKANRSYTKFQSTQEALKLKTEQLKESSERELMSTADYEELKRKHNAQCLQPLPVEEGRNLESTRSLMGETLQQRNDEIENKDLLQEAVNDLQRVLDEDSKAAWNDLQTYLLETAPIARSLQLFQIAAEAHQTAWESTWKKFSLSKEKIQELQKRIKLEKKETNEKLIARLKANISQQEQTFKESYKKVESLHKGIFSFAGSQQERENSIQDLVAIASSLFDFHNELAQEERKHNYKQNALLPGEQECQNAFLLTLLDKKNEKETYLRWLKLTPQEKNKEYRLSRYNNFTNWYNGGYIATSFESLFEAERRGAIKEALFYYTALHLFNLANVFPSNVGASFNGGGIAFCCAAERLAQIMELEKSQEAVRASKWRAVAALLESSGVCFSNDRGYDIYHSRDRFGYSPLYYAGSALSNAAMELEQTIEVEKSQVLQEAASASRSYEAIELDKLSAEVSIWADRAYVRGNRMEGYSWREVGRDLFYAAVGLHKAIEAEKSRNPQKAAKLRAKAVADQSKAEKELLMLKNRYKKTEVQIENR